MKSGMSIRIFSNLIEPGSVIDFSFCRIVIFFIYFRNIFQVITFPSEPTTPITRRELPSLRGDRGKRVYTGQNRFCVFYLRLFLFLHFCSLLPLPSTCRLTPSPCPGTACGLHTFLLRRKVIYCLSKTQFTRAVILERRAEQK